MKDSSKVLRSESEQCAKTLRKSPLMNSFIWSDALPVAQVQVGLQRLIFMNDLMQSKGFIEGLHCADPFKRSMPLGQNIFSSTPG
jgi:hypothetical protein